MSKTFHEVYVDHLQCDDGSMTFQKEKMMYSSETDCLTGTAIHLKDQFIFIAWSYFGDCNSVNRNWTSKKLDYSLNEIDNGPFGFCNGGYNILSKDKSNVYNFQTYGRSCSCQDVNLTYSLFTFEGQPLINQSNILTVLYDHSSDHGPFSYGYSFVEDRDENIWIFWNIRSGDIFQVLLWKIDIYGTPQIPIIIVSSNGIYDIEIPSGPSIPGFQRHLLVLLSIIAIWILLLDLMLELFGGSKTSMEKNGRKDN